MKTSEKIVCYLGATIVNLEIQKRVQKYSNHARTRLGLDAVIIPEQHITILPPFATTYESASHLNLACACATLVAHHPLTSSKLSIQQLALMKWKEEMILHFPVNFCGGLHPENIFVDYVQALKKKVLTSGEFIWKEAVPETFHPHLTVLKAERVQHAERMQEFVDQSMNDCPICFDVGYPTLYAKYKTGGWYPLSQNPNSAE